MTIWEFQACLEGYQKANTPSHAVNNDPMTDEQYEALCALGDQFNGKQ